MDEECPEYRSGNFYDLSKYEIDSYVKLFEGCEYYGLRFGTVNGPSPNFRTDIMINAMYVSALNNKHIRINNPHIRRPILGIKDLGRAVLSIIKNGTDAKRGIYNLASFNSTVELIGRHVSDYMDVPLEFTPDSPNVYDFAISTKKFEQAFDFTFQETVKTIITDIRQQHEHLRFTHRNKIIPYPQDE
jgi:nucleoside-diphosphate-sugar epimerase